MCGIYIYIYIIWNSRAAALKALKTFPSLAHEVWIIHTLVLHRAPVECKLMFAVNSVESTTILDANTHDERLGSGFGVLQCKYKYESKHVNYVVYRKTGKINREKSID